MPVTTAICPLYQGKPVAKDPTANVISLMELHAKRADDLRIAHHALDAERYKHQADMAELRAEHSRAVEEKETDRLNAIRQVDVSNSDSKAATVALAVSALSTVTTTNNENIRKALETTVGNINERLLGLERKQSEGTGSSRVSDPQMIELVRDIKIIAANQATGAGANKGSRDTSAWVATVVMGAIAAASVAVALLK